MSDAGTASSAGRSRGHDGAHSSPLDFAVLGPLEVTGLAGPVPITGPRERAVLTLLTAWAGQVVSLDRLTDALWGERPPQSNVKVIRNLMSQVRKVLGADAIETCSSGYALRAAPGAVDVRRFDRLLHEGHQCAESGRWQAAAIAFSAASELWRGPPLTELGDWPPACAEAARLEEEHRSLVEELAEAELACGRHHAVVASLETMVEAEPLRERRWALLMLALSRCGRQAEALRAFQRARTVLAELGLEPGAELRSLEQDVSVQYDRAVASMGGDARRGAGVDRPGNLPRPATDLVGRVHELQERIAELAFRRLMTLTGTGGVGKTRLAIEVAWSLADDFSDGVWMVPLAPVTHPSAVVAAVASTMSIQPKSGLTMEQSIVEWLRGRHLLLLFDNCEHVLGPLTRLVETVVTGCPTVTVLATSREPLDVPGEWVHVVTPLDAATEAVELFCDRAVAADEGFTPSDDDRVTITSICRQVDGLPLAIELAAARIRSSSPADLLCRLDNRFRLLRRSGQGSPARHQALRATVDWSYRLLDERERLIFDRLSVFAGGFDLAAVEAVCADGLEQSDVAYMLDSLVAKSMVVAHRTEVGVRYSLLETLRQYGQARVDERGENDALRGHHLGHYIEVGTRARELWASPRQLDAQMIFDHEWDNLRAAHSWSVSVADSGSADAIVAATGPHAWCRLNHEHGDWATRALALGVADRPAAPATYGWSAFWLFIAYDADRSAALAQEGIEAASVRRQADTIECWAVLIWAQLVAGRSSEAAGHHLHTRIDAGDPEDRLARAWAHCALVEEALAADGPSVSHQVTEYAEWADRVGAPSIRSDAAFYQGQLRMSAEPPCSEEALGFYMHGRDLARQAGDIHEEGKNVLGVVWATTALRTVEATAIAHEALQRLYDNRHWSLIWTGVEIVASGFLATNVEVAATIYGQLEAHHPPWGGTRGKRGRAKALAWLCEQPHADVLKAKGEAMTDDQVITLALDQLARQANAEGTGSQHLDRSNEAAPA